MLYSKNNSKSLRYIVKPLIWGVFLGASLCALLPILSALLITKSGNIPYSFMIPMMLVFAGLGAFAGGYISAFISKESGMLYGAMCGFILFSMIFTGGIIIAHESVTMITAIRALTMVLCGSIGGIIGVNKK